MSEMLVNELSNMLAEGLVYDFDKIESRVSPPADY
jgi:hypothetical protein